MRNILAVLGAVVVTFLVVGYFLDWYKIHPTPDHQVTIDVNASKIVSDVKKEGQEISSHLQEKKQDGTPPATPPVTQERPLPSAPDAILVRPNGTTSTTPNASPWQLP